VTFNAGGGDAVAPNLALLLDRWRPHLVAFQECGPRLVAAVERAEGWHRHQWDGLCLLSRFPILGAEAMDRSALARIHETTAIGGSGNVVRYVLAAPGGTIHLTNLHLETPRKGIEGLVRLDWERFGANTELRGIEARLARRWADAGAGPMLVAGDFNTPVESHIYRRSWSGLKNAFSARGRGFGMTRYNGWIRARIDHVLMEEGWRAEAAEVGPDAGSDHRPLIVDLRRVRTD
jgi:vancomycin resistance protein VanJ